MTKKLYRDIDIIPTGCRFLESASAHDVHEKPTISAFHSHKGILLHYMISGNLTRELEDGSRQILRGGDISLVQPNVRHRGEYGITHPSKYLSLVISTKAARRYLPFSSAVNKDILRTLEKAGNHIFRGNPEITSIVHSLQTVIKEPGSPYRPALVNILLAQLILGAVRSLKHPCPSPKYYVVTKACRLLEQSGCTRTVSQIARAVGMGPSRFRELFKQEMGQTVSDYRLQFRCEQARIKLLNTSDTMTRIAMDIGFSSSQYFVRSFRKYMGQTPSAYRKHLMA